MTILYTHMPHPRIAERKLSGPAKVHDQVKRQTPIQRVNARVGLFITVVVGTMWCAYLFTCISLVALPSAINSHNFTIIVAWLSSYFLQLVLLPIIIVGQNIQARAADKRAEDTYKDADAVLHEALQIQLHLKAQDTAISDILDRVNALSVGPAKS
ncbi:MAG TPA: hypothetical protein VK277_03850 [Acidimicrobiales bacterium]|nr:hypothetical protein [Acidimicrobiales bacterium]